MSKIWLIPLVFTILIASSFGNAFAMFDSFLKIDGVEGESTDDKHKGQIEIDSFSWGVSNAGSMATGGGTGKASFSDFTITKTVDLSMRKAGGTQMDYYVIHLEDVLVSSYSTSGGSSEAPMESISFNYQKIEFQYIPTNADGTAAAAVKASWNLKENTR